jgi:hypothetical protein
MNISTNNNSMNPIGNDFDYEYDYQAVIFINNCAVTMMERSCHEQAYATLKNAADVSKILIRCNDPYLAYDLISRKLNATLERMSNPVRSTSTSNRSSFPLNVNVISHHDGDQHGNFNVNTPNALIRVDDTDHDDLLENDLLDDYDVVSDVPRLLLAIVFYNHAVVYTHYLDNNNATDYHADKYLFLAFRLTCNCYRDVLSRDKGDVFLMRRTVTIAAIIRQMLPTEGQTTNDSKGSALDHMRSVAYNKLDENPLYSSHSNASSSSPAA